MFDRGAQAGVHFAGAHTTAPPLSPPQHAGVRRYAALITRSHRHRHRQQGLRHATLRERRPRCRRGRPRRRSDAQGDARVGCHRRPPARRVRRILEPPAWPRSSTGELIALTGQSFEDGSSSRRQPRQTYPRQQLHDRRRLANLPAFPFDMEGRPIARSRWSSTALSDARPRHAWADRWMERPRTRGTRLPGARRRLHLTRARRLHARRDDRPHEARDLGDALNYVNGLLEPKTAS